MISSARRKQHRFGHRSMHWYRRVDFSHLGITDGVLGSASGSAHSFAAERSIEKNPMMASTIVAQPKVICAVVDEIR
ncbi:MAG: hypothetical protein DME80_02960 [Verrucomicrobia bacterium]|nr:MAG: hypothetical protein DME80_02960 [Verrucomicrobiota bacterium]